MDLSDTTEVVCFRFSSYLNRSFLRPLWRLPSGKQNFITCRKLILFSLVDPLPTPPSLHSRQRQRYRIHRTPFSTSTPTHGNLKHNNNCKESASKLGNWENAFIFWTNPTSHPRSSKTKQQRTARRNPQLLHWFRPFFFTLRHQLRSKFYYKSFARRLHFPKGHALADSVYYKLGVDPSSKAASYLTEQIPGKQTSPPLHIHAKYWSYVRRSY